MTKKEVNGTFPCPVCSEKFKIPRDGAKGLSRNPGGRNAFLGEDSDILPQGSGKGEECDVCKLKEVDSQAVSMCIQCREHLCEKCAQIHCGGATLTASHRVVSIDDVKSGQYLEEIRRFQKVYCPIHKDEVVKIYCESCKKPVCFLCFAVEHTKHQMKTVDRAARYAGEVARGLFEPWKGATDHCEILSDDRKKFLDDLVNQEETMTTEVRRVFSEFKTETVREIEVQEDATIKKLRERIATARKQLETWHEEAEFQKTKLTSTLEYATSIFDSAQDVEKLRQFEDIKSQLESLDIKSIETKSKKPVFKLQLSKIAVPDLNVDVVTEFETKETMSKLREKLVRYMMVLRQALPSDVFTQ